MPLNRWNANIFISFIFCKKLFLIKSVHFEKTVTWSSFLSKSVVILKITTLFERNEGRVTGYLKWTDFSTPYQKIGDLFCPVHISGLSHSVLNKSPPKCLFVLFFEIANWTRISLDLTEYSKPADCYCMCWWDQKERKKSNSGSSVI